MFLLLTGRLQNLKNYPGPLAPNEDAKIKIKLPKITLKKIKPRRRVKPRNHRGRPRQRPRLNRDAPPPPKGTFVIRNQPESDCISQKFWKLYIGGWDFLYQLHSYWLKVRIKALKNCSSCNVSKQNPAVKILKNT